MNYSLQRTNGSGYCERKLADEDDESLAGPAAAVSSGCGEEQRADKPSRKPDEFLPTGPQLALE